MIRYLRDAAAQSLRGTALLSLNFDTEDDWRIEASIPTVKFLLKKSAKVVVVSHHGRPSGFVQKLSLRKRAAMLARLIGRKVVFVPHFDSKKIKATIEAAPAGSVFLLENLRFNKGEWNNDPKFAKQLATLADFFVNDDFATAHHANASNVAITKFLPSYAGFEMESEIKSLSRIMKQPEHPFVFIVGGAKAADKLGTLKFFKNKADWFLLGGGPANTILSLRGVDVKKSIRDIDPKDVKEMQAFSRNKNVVVPVDFKWHSDLIWDIGPKTARLFAAKIATARAVLWGGPLGMIEKPAYARGSVAVAKAVVKNRRAFSVSGGGETVMFLKKYGFDKKFSFISTGGGAMIDFLAGKKLPAIEALK